MFLRICISGRKNMMMISVQHGRETEIIGGMSDYFSAMQRKWKNFKIRPKWISDALWDGFLLYWATKGFIKRSSAGVNNRAKGPRCTHTTGSRNINEHHDLLAKETGRTEIPRDELYMSTRVQCPEKSVVIDSNTPVKWANPKSKKHHKKYKEYIVGNYDSDEWPICNNEGWRETTGPPKKEKVPGLPSHSNPADYGIEYRKRRTYHPGESSRTAELWANFSEMQANQREIMEESKQLKESLAARDKEIADMIQEQDRKFEEARKKMEGEVQQKLDEMVAKKLEEYFSKQGQGVKQSEDSSGEESDDGE